MNRSAAALVVTGVRETSTTIVRVDRQLAAAAAAQVTLLLALSVTVGLGPAGWLAGAAFGLGLWLCLGAAAQRAGTSALGPADVVTLARAALVGGVTALVADGFATGATAVATLVVLAAVALVLDGVDGKVARRTGTASELGARFDMEVDSFLVLVLSGFVAVVVTPAALVIGVMRYVFVVASWSQPWMRSPLPARFSAKVVAALQGVVLVIAAAGILAAPLAVALVVGALGLLLWSFGKSVAWQRRHARAAHALPRLALPAQVR